MNRFSIIATLMLGTVVVVPDLQAQRYETIADVVIASGDGFDVNPGDFDILLAAVKEADLVGALSNPDAELTVFMPNDLAFILLARDLGYQGISEEARLEFYPGERSPLIERYSLVSCRRARAHDNRLSISQVYAGNRYEHSNREKIRPLFQDH